MAVRDMCDAAISIDADLQDDPEAIVRMVEEFRLGKEIVYGVRSSRATDTWFSVRPHTLSIHCSTIWASTPSTTMPITVC